MAKDKHLSEFAVIVPAGGSGLRYGAICPKQFVPLAGAQKTCPFCLTVRWYVAHTKAKVYAALPGKRRPCEQCPGGEIRPICVTGGSTRQRSVYEALLRVHRAGHRWVLIHDAARPFVRDYAVEDVMKKLREGSMSVNTVYYPSAGVVTLSGNKMTGLLAAKTVGLGQCPQGFPVKALLAAHRKARKLRRVFADDCSLMMAMTGCTTEVVWGDWDGFKITFPQDYELAKRVYEWRYLTGWQGMERI